MVNVSQKAGRTVYLNGSLVNEQEAAIPFFDRGFMFGDGVYEVTAVIGGRLVDFAPHRGRLRRSLAEIALECPLDEARLLAIHEELIARNGLENGTVYVQITRGASDRDFLFPAGQACHVVAFTQENDIVANRLGQSGLRIKLAAEQRWLRRDIKSVGLLAQVMAKQDARLSGFDDAWLVEDGHVTEGTSSTAFIVDASGALITRHLDNRILPGITREVVMDIARRQGVAVVERPFSAEEAKAAREAFATSASTFVLPVTSLDGRAIGSGQPGPVTGLLRNLYIERASGTSAVPTRATES